MVTWSRRFQSTSKAYSRDFARRDAQRVVEEDLWGIDGPERLAPLEEKSRLTVDPPAPRWEPEPTEQAAAAPPPPDPQPAATEGASQRLWRKVRGWLGR